MFKSSAEGTLKQMTDAFREWTLPAGAVIVEQATPIATGPGLCMLFSGVVDVLHRPKGSSEAQKMCTYDRCGQCFGELELILEPVGSNAARARKLHWATIAARTPTVLWVVERSTLKSYFRDSLTDQATSTSTKV